MRLVVQRVSEARVSVEGEITGAIRAGLMVLVGVGREDTGKDAERMAAKLANLRIFPDEEGKMNRSVLDSGGAVLIVSQFTLYADTRKGNRPSFIEAAEPDRAATLIAEFAAELRSRGVHVEEGRFGAHMEIGLVNDGPVTIILSSSKEGAT